MIRIPQNPASGNDQTAGRIAHLTETNINKIFGSEDSRTETASPIAAIIDDPITTGAGAGADIITGPISAGISDIPDHGGIPDRRDSAAIAADRDLDDQQIEPTAFITIKSAAIGLIATIWRRAISAFFDRGRYISPIS